MSNLYNVKTVYELAEKIEEVHRLRGVKDGNPNGTKIDTKDGILQQFYNLDFSRSEPKIFYINRSDELNKEKRAKIRKGEMVNINISVESVIVDEEGYIIG